MEPTALAMHNSLVSSFIDIAESARGCTDGQGQVSEWLTKLCILM